MNKKVIIAIFFMISFVLLISIRYYNSIVLTDEKEINDFIQKKYNISNFLIKDTIDLKGSKVVLIDKNKKYAFLTAINFC